MMLPISRDAERGNLLSIALLSLFLLTKQMYTASTVVKGGASVKVLSRVAHSHHPK